jgi:hypothetical protein
MNNKKSSPSTEEIEKMLRSLRPNPSRKFYDNMRFQPWKRYPNLSLWKQLYQPRKAIIVLIAILLAIGIVLVAPSFNVLAFRIAQFFTSTTEEKMLIELPLYENLEQEEYPLTTLSEAIKQANFVPQTPSKLPEGHTFSGANYHPIRQSITLNYATNTGSILRITERPVGIEYQSISVHAKVEKVQIGDEVGEYVRGGWRASEFEKDPSNKTITVQATWDPENNIHFLRWQEEDILFEILYIGSSPDIIHSLNKKELIEIAENLK